MYWKWNNHNINTDGNPWLLPTTEILEFNWPWCLSVNCAWLYRDEEKGLSTATMDNILNLTCSEPAFEGLLPGPLEQGEGNAPYISYTLLLCTLGSLVLVCEHFADVISLLTRIPSILIPYPPTFFNSLPLSVPNPPTPFSLILQCTHPSHHCTVTARASSHLQNNPQWVTIH